MIGILRLSVDDDQADDHDDADDDDEAGVVSAEGEDDGEESEECDHVAGDQVAEGSGTDDLVQVETLSQILSPAAAHTGAGVVAGEQFFLTVIEILLRQRTVSWTRCSHASVPVPQQQDTHPHHGVGEQCADAHHVHQLRQVKQERHHSCQHSRH